MEINYLLIRLNYILYIKIKEINEGIGEINPAKLLIYE